MAIDIRATVTCSLGTLISGSISDDYLQGSGLVKTKGSVEISGTITPAIGTVVTFSYVKGGVTRSIPRKLRVMSSFADPFRRTTKVELGCKLTYLSDLKDRLDWTAFDDPENAALTEADAEIITIPIRASSIMTKCLTEIGITASSSPLTNQFSIPEFDFSPGYVQILSDLLVSESYFGYLDTSEVLQVRNLAVGTGTGPVFTSADIVDLGPIGVGQLPGEAVTVSYSTLKLRNSATEEGASNEIPAPPDPVTEPEEYEIWDRGSQQARWEFSESIGAPTLVSLQFPAPTGTKSFTYIPYSSISSSYTSVGGQDQLAQQTEISNSIAASDYGTYLVNIFTAGVPSVTPGVATQSRVITTYTYGGSTRTITKQQYEPYAKAAGGMSVPFAFSAGDYVILPSTEIKTAVTFSEVRISGSVTQTKTTSYLLWHQTIEGQQAIAEGRQNFTTSAEVAAYINSIISQGPVYAGTEISTQYTASLPPARPSQSDLINQSLTKDPEDTADEEADPTTYRTESVAELELAVGSSAAQRRIELSMPYAPDDRFTKSGTDYYAISSDAPQKAARYGRTQNRLLLGNRNGINLQLAPERLPAAPFEPLYVQANGLTAQYRANGTSWAFDSNGIVASVDALFWSAVGGTGTFWFPVAPGITTLPTTPAIVDGTMTPTTVVLPYNETAVYNGILRTRLSISKFDYSLSLLTVVPALNISIDLGIQSSTAFVVVPAAVTTLAVQLPEVASGGSVAPPTATTALSPLAPQVSSGASAAIPLTDIGFEASMVPYVGTAATVVQPPAANAGLFAALVPGVASGVSVSPPAVDIAMAGTVPAISTKAPPVVSLAGSPRGATSAITPDYSSVLTNDILLLVVETSGDGSNITPGPGEPGWNVLAGTPLFDGNVTPSFGSKLHVWWYRAAAPIASGSVTFADSGDHQLGRVYLIRGCATTGDPFDVVGTATKATPSTTASAPSVTTTVAQTLVLSIVSQPVDSSTPQFGAPSNTGLTSLTNADQQATNFGNGGGYVVTTGIKRLSGDTGVTTYASAPNTSNASVVIAFKP